MVHDRMAFAIQRWRETGSLLENLACLPIQGARTTADGHGTTAHSSARFDLQMNGHRALLFVAQCLKGIIVSTKQARQISPRRLRCRHPIAWPFGGFPTIGCIVGRRPSVTQQPDRATSDDGQENENPDIRPARLNRRIPVRLSNFHA
jgi:hypothetical protein